MASREEARNSGECNMGADLPYIHAEAARREANRHHQNECATDLRKDPCTSGTGTAGTAGTQAVPSGAALLNPMIGIGGAPTRNTTLPTLAKERKEYPMATGLLDYFPDALAAVAYISYRGNQQHNPGQPLNWARGKSADEADTLIRHMTQRGTLDVDGVRHSAKVAWRALAMLQKEIEDEQQRARRQQEELAAKAEAEAAQLRNQRADIQPCCRSYFACGRFGCVPRFIHLVGREPNAHESAILTELRRRDYNAYRL